MHSKWQIWDFFSSFDRKFLDKFQGPLALNTFDPVCLKLVKDFLFRGADEKVIRHKMAGEVNRGWIQEEFQTLSLFGEYDNFFIHQAHDLSNELMDLITGLDLQGRFLVLSFENEGASWKKMLKEGKIQTLHVEHPRFWELNKLLDFAAAYVRLPLSYEAKGWMLDSLENNLATFYNCCCLIKLNHPDTKEVSLSAVKELLSIERLDQFALASMFARKKSTVFFEKLVSLEGDFEKMRAFFYFIQSHLLKMADTSYLHSKSRLTQYDKDIQNCAKLWQLPEIMKEVERFSRWEVMCKQKNNFLWHELRRAHLSSLYLPSSDPTL